MGANCSCACGLKGHHPSQAPRLSEVAASAAPRSSTVRASSVVQGPAEPQPGEAGYAEWQRSRLMARTADELGGIHSDPPGEVAVEVVNKNHIRKSLQGQSGPARGTLTPNTFRNSVVSGGGPRMSEDYTTTSALNRDLASE